MDWFAERVEACVNREGPQVPYVTGRCWVWQGWCNADGYGLLSASVARGGPAAPSRLVHRHAWTQVCGPIPAGMCVLHRCDTRACVNPDHLFLGTRLDNCRDCAAKGRTAKGDANGTRLFPERVSRGEKHSQIVKPRVARGDAHYMRRSEAARARHRGDLNATRVNPDCVLKGSARAFAKLTETDVREIRAMLRMGSSQAAAARRFNVSNMTISLLARGKRWKHVHDDG